MTDSLIEYNLKRSGFDDTYDDQSIYLIGLIIYLVIFGALIPYILIKNNMYTILEGYMPNLDLIACVLGYSEGPFGIFKYLYNPSSNTVNGIFSSLVINYTALLGVTYLIAHYTLKSNNVIKGWSRSVIMLLMTYLVPGYIIAYLTYYIGVIIDPYFKIGTIGNWLIIACIGLTIVFFIIITEILLIENLSNTIFRSIKYFNQMIQQF